MPKTRTLGRTGLEVTELGFGAWPIGGALCGPTDKSDAVAAVEAYLEAGGNFIDTARGYNTSEQIIGEVLAGDGHRKRVLIATKTQASRSIETIPQIREELEQSLRLLQTDYVDLYYLHAPPDEPDVMNRVLDEYEKLKDEGKIRWIGASIKGASVTEDTAALCRQYIATGRVDVIQVVYSILRQMLHQVIVEAREAGVGVVVRTMLESGFLTGKYKPGHVFTDSNRKRWAGEGLEAILAAVGRIESEVVRPPFESVTQAAIGFALEPVGVSSVIPGARNAEQVRQNMAVDDLPALDRETLDWLRAEYGYFTLKANPATNAFS